MSPRSLRRAALALAILATLSACDRGAPAEKAAPVAAAPTPAAPTVGIDLAAMDKTVQPGDAFYTYANGAWQASAEIPADRASIGVFYTVFEKAEKRLSDLVQGCLLYTSRCV